MYYHIGNRELSLLWNLVEIYLIITFGEHWWSLFLQSLLVNCMQKVPNELFFYIHEITVRWVCSGQCADSTMYTFF